jgi:hypothetical protein
MKKTLTLIAAAAALTLLPVQAGTVADNCGCGLGRMALGEETGLLSHIAATFLNALSGNQTFGISSGTLDCEQAGQMVSVKEVEVFVADNMDHIATEAAMGEGAYLSALADLLNVKPADREAFYLSMQANFDTIFAGTDANAGNVTRSIVQLI